MERFLVFAVALAALVSVSFADVGPPPADLPRILVHAEIDGAPVPDGTICELHCFVGGEEAGAPGWRGYCRNGTCEAGAIYKLNPCAREGGNATFEFSHASFAHNYTTSPPVPVAKGKDYAFNVSISSSAGTAIMVGSESNPQQPICGITFILLALAAVPLLGFAGAFKGH